MSYEFISRRLAEHDTTESQELAKLLDLMHPHARHTWLHTPHPKLSYRTPGNQITLPALPNIGELWRLLQSDFPTIEEDHQTVTDAISDGDACPVPMPEVTQLAPLPARSIMRGTPLRGIGSLLSRRRTHTTAK
jgi:hypothetical protein